MAFPIYKSRDTENVRVYARQTGPDVWEFTTTKGRETVEVIELSGDEARKMLTGYAVAESLSFFRHFRVRSAI
ncbi:hypothetical protein [Streptomyces hydrogenans]|uniref:hypothetical protein n=1 Tax=Streptomyces hydrogenans TaxID=1873719 RepID=UPI0035E10E71